MVLANGRFPSPALFHYNGSKLTQKAGVVTCCLGIGHAYLF